MSFFLSKIRIKNSNSSYITYIFFAGANADIFPHGIELSSAQNFPRRCAEICSKWSHSNTRALDLGCAVGGATFHLTKYYSNVLGIDFSGAFIEAALDIQVNRSKTLQILKEGKL